MIDLKGGVAGFMEGLRGKAPNQERPPYNLAGSRGVLGGPGGGIPAGQVAQLAAYGNVGWLFAAVNRIASSVAAVEWNLYRKGPKGNELVEKHPLIDLWSSVNPFFTREEFVETFSQHLELTGEAWWLLVRQGSAIKELWPLRPDRIRPVPDRNEYICGYVYRIGAEEIRLEPEDVVFVRQPNPMDTFRGMSVVQALMPDLSAERSSARWTNAFFENSAVPGGYIEYPEMLSDEDYDRLAKRWSEMHRGTGNAHRVAIIESGKWVEAKYTQRDMQFTELRKLNREIILGALSVPPHMLGISESVNRANAEAAEVMFSRNVVVPRCRRIRASLNTRLIPLVDSTKSLFFDYVDPTPEDRVSDLQEADRGYTSGLLTQNEGRGLLGYSEVPGGDEFNTPASTPFGLSLANREPERKVWSIPLPMLKQTDLDRTERDVKANWTKRLRDEAEAITAFMVDYFKANGTFRTKIELSDLQGYDWDWWKKYSDKVIPELTELFHLSILGGYPDIEPIRAQTLASQYAEFRGAQLLQVTGDFNLAEITRFRVNALVSRAIDEGQSLGTLQKNLRDDVAFSPERARTVARTETATALGQGEKEAAQEQGRDEKLWISQADGLVSDACMINERAGWILIGEKFPSGRDTIPQHPNCRCVVRYRTSEKALKDIEEFRCPDCNRLLIKDGEMTCKKCHAKVPARAVR